MRLLFACSVLLWASSAIAQPSQTTYGWCSPAVANVAQKVTIVCNGVDPKALARLNELLDLKQQQLVDRIRDAEEWARKYRELEARLATASPSGNEARAAQLLKEGKLEEAGRLLDALLGEEQQLLDRLATRHFNRAEIYSLEYRPMEALPHYRKAYGYSPQTAEYGLRLGRALLTQREFGEAETVYREILERNAAQTAGGSGESLAVRAEALTWLATLVPKERQAYGAEVVKIYRQLATQDAKTYRPKLAEALARNGVYSMNAAELEESADILQSLAAETPEKRAYYLASAGSVLTSDYVVLHVFRKDEKGARAAQDRVVKIYEVLRQEDRNMIPLEMAGSSFTVAGLYMMSGKNAEAEKLLDDTITLLRKYSKPGDEYYQYLPLVLATRGQILSKFGRSAEALSQCEEAAAISRRLMERSPSQYAPTLEKTLDALARVYRYNGRSTEAESIEAEWRAVRDKYAIQR